MRQGLERGKISARCGNGIGRSTNRGNWKKLANGGLTMVDVLNDVRVRTVTTDEINGFGDHGRMLANVNTPSEYGALEALQGHQP